METSESTIVMRSRVTASFHRYRETTTAEVTPPQNHLAQLELSMPPLSPHPEGEEEEEDSSDLRRGVMMVVTGLDTYTYVVASNL